jgi:hypothetical protein
MDAILLEAIMKKHKERDSIARFNELLRYILRCSISERISFKERRIMSPTTTALPY